MDPKYANIKQFETEYLWFIAAFTGFMVAIYFYTLSYALGYKLPIQNIIIPFMAALFFSIGVLLKKVKSNYTIGLRLPWTLHSEKNWDLTHQLANKTFTYGATIMLLTLFIGKFEFAGFITTITVMVLIPIIYSYQLHRKGI